MRYGNGSSNVEIGRARYHHDGVITELKQMNFGVGGQNVRVFSSAVPFTVSGVSTNTVTVVFAEPVLVNPADSVDAYGHGNTDYSGSWDMRMGITVNFSDGTSYYDSGDTDDDAEAGNVFSFGRALTSSKYLTQVRASIHFIDAPTGTQVVDSFGLTINGVSYDLMQNGEINIS